LSWILATGFADNQLSLLCLCFGQATENPCVDGSIPSLGTTNHQVSRPVVYDSKAGFLFENDHYA